MITSGVNGSRRTGQPGRRRLFGVSGAVSVALAASLLLSACAPTDPSGAATERLDASVVQTADRAASGDYAGASASLDGLQARLAEYVEAGDVTADRSAEIQAAIDAVRADLTALIAAQSSPTPEPAPSTDSGTGVTDPAPDPVETVPDTVVTPPVEDTDTDNTGGNPGNGNSGSDKPGKGNSGNGNNGNGNKNKQ